MKQSSTRTFPRWILLLGSCGLLLLGLSSCQWLDSNQENYVFVFVEELGFNSISCGREREHRQGSGFHTLCEDSVLFSHAYTNSPLSPVALASFLTASAPAEHKTGAGAEKFLSSAYTTLAEAAWEKDLHTWMFSGGAPIFRKSGFSQGFEVFEDHVPLHHGKYFRPFRENLKTFFRLMDSRAKPGFFAVFYVPDLLFHEVETVDDDLGLPREKSYEGQLEEVNQALGDLFHHLKTSGQWSKTHIVVAGLNAKPNFDRPSEMAGTNLYSERVHVSLFVKPARKKRGEHPQKWKINHNVSLMDLGATYFDSIQGVFASTSSPLSPVSLRPILAEPGTFLDTYRPIEISSSWSRWRKMGNVRRSLRIGYDFILYDEPPVSYNTLVDRMEMSPLNYPEDGSEVRSPAEEWENVYLEEMKTWEGLDPTFEQKVSWAKIFFGPTAQADELNVPRLRRFLREDRPNDLQLASWLAHWALERGEWNLLSELGSDFKQPFWQYVARAHLKLSPPKIGEDDCGFIFSNARTLERRAMFKDCEDDVFVELINWVLEKDSERRPFVLETFLQSFFDTQSAKRIAEMNYVKGLIWDVPLSEPKGPSLSELFLHLPENASLLRQVRARWRSRFEP